MKYQKYPYRMRYKEWYYPTKDSTELKVHVRKKENVLCIKDLEDEEFPVACIVKNDRGTVEHRYFDDSFWRQMEEDAEPEKKFVEYSNCLYRYKYPSAGSEDDIDQGWNEELSVVMENDEDLHRVVQWKERIESLYVIYKDRTWTKVEEPYYYEGHPNRFEYRVTTSNIDNSPRVENPSHIIDIGAYSLLDKDRMLSMMDKFEKENPDSPYERKIDDVEVLMPEAFHFGNDIPNWLKEHALERMPEDLDEFLDKLRDADKGSWPLLDFLREHLPGKLIEVLDEEDEPYYHLDDDHYWKAVRRLLDELAEEE